MTPSDPNAPIIRRFNGYHGRSSIPIRTPWKLHTQKLFSAEWVTIARFPSLAAEYQAEQWERIGRHAGAFGGFVRLMRGELLLASWRDGTCEVDLRDELEEAS